MRNVYDAPESNLVDQDKEKAHENYQYAGFWVRTGAAIMDSVLIILVTMPILYLVYGEAYFSQQDTFHGVFELILNYVFPLVVTIAFWKYKSATPGKMAVRAIIVDARTGGQPSTGQLILRYVGYFVSMVPLFLGIFWVGWDSRKQGWHDKIASTVVIRPRNGSAEPVKFDKAP